MSAPETPQPQTPADDGLKVTPLTPLDVIETDALVGELYRRSPGVLVFLENPAPTGQGQSPEHPRIWVYYYNAGLSKAMGMSMRLVSILKDAARQADSTSSGQ
jgi:hypothetical protein